MDCGGNALLLSLCVTFPGFVKGHHCWSLAHIDIMQKTYLYQGVYFGSDLTLMAVDEKSLGILNALYINRIAIIFLSKM